MMGRCAVMDEHLRSRTSDTGPIAQSLEPMCRCGVPLPAKGREPGHTRRNYGYHTGVQAFLEHGNEGSGKGSDEIPLEASSEATKGVGSEARPSPTLQEALL